MIRQFLPIFLVLFTACHLEKTTEQNHGSSGKIGEFSFERSADGSTTRFLKSGHVLGRYDVFFLLGHAQEMNTEHGKDFRKLFNESIATLDVQGKNGIAFKTPILNKDTQVLPFYYVAIPENFATIAQDTFKNYLSHCPIKLNGSDYRSTEYNEKYVKTLSLIDGKLEGHKNGESKKDVDGVVYFYNQGKSNQLISPCPFNKDIKSLDNNDLVNIYSYAKRLNDQIDTDHETRLQSLWFAVGEGVLNLLNANENIFLSTEGHAVDYLHIRLQKKPTYYESVSELKDKDSSQAYYLSKFPK